MEIINKKIENGYIFFQSVDLPRIQTKPKHLQCYGQNYSSSYSYHKKLTKLISPNNFEFEWLDKFAVLAKDLRKGDIIVAYQVSQCNRYYNSVESGSFIVIDKSKRSEISLAAYQTPLKASKARARGIGKRGWKYNNIEG